jgi:FtsP/CotA-like multicopper oxidase with cupredoxin domain
MDMHARKDPGLLVAGLLMAFAFPASAGPVGIVCTAGPTFNLKATSGYIQPPDGNSVFMWGYAPLGGPFQMPGPTLCVNEGDTVTINLTNNLPDPPGAVLPENTSIVFPGQTNVTPAGGVAGLFTNEASPGGGVSYSFVASEPGTYLYESGTNPHKQVHMGLYGTLIVRPSMGNNFAYNDADTEFDPAREYLVSIHEIDPDLHRRVELGQSYNVTLKHDRYWTINGRSFPDTVQDNATPILPAQPYGALIQVVAATITSPGLPALIRYNNAGMANHPLHPHGNHYRVIARDGRLLQGPGNQDASMESFTKTIGSGQTYDLLTRWINLEGWNSANNVVPVTIPSLQNLVFKDGVTYYSGSPYLGEQRPLPAGTAIFNECGEFYFPVHSHALNEFQNFDEGFGGLATIWRVDPPVGCP